MKRQFAARLWVVCGAFSLAVAATAVADQTALDEYVARPDPAYGYHLQQTDRTFFYHTDFLMLTSQQWRYPEEVDRPVWEHELQITVPTWRYSPSPRTALLIINGGSNDGTPNTETGDLLSTLSMVTGSVVAMVSQIPNEPLYFADEVDRPRTEDAILAYSLDKLLTTGDPEWAVHLAMTKAVVRAMDSVQSWLSWRGIPVDDFIVLGGSKRGWTAWLTAAVDHRVRVLVPVSSDLLNLGEQFKHQWEALGFYVPAISDYVEFDLPCRAESPEALALLQVVDPYSYRDRYTMPKLLINSAGDQFFLSDSSRFYFGALPEPKQLRYTFNTDHAQGADSITLLDVVFSSLSSLRDVEQGDVRSRFTWTFEPDGSIRVVAQERPDEVYLVQATNPTARDFRLEVIGPAWSRFPLMDQGGGVYVGFVPPPSQGWTAFAIELVFDAYSFSRRVLTTDVRVTPEYLPFAGTACQAATP